MSYVLIKKNFITHSLYPTYTKIDKETSAQYKPGYYYPIPSSDFCIECPAGYYCTLGASEPTICPIGTYCPTPGMTGPVSCPFGTYCPTEGATGPVSCPAGKTTRDIGSYSESQCVNSELR